jgi:hypothetical protein
MVPDWGGVVIPVPPAQPIVNINAAVIRANRRITRSLLDRVREPTRIIPNRPIPCIQIA